VKTIIEEVLQEIGTLDIGEGIEGKVSVARRTRAGHRPLIGEFFIALQCAGQHGPHWTQQKRDRLLAAR
jgi:hypothetical protein